jgi:Glycosyl hydrolase family 79 C-terminal beta domain
VISAAALVVALGAISTSPGRAQSGVRESVQASGAQASVNVTVDATAAQRKVPRGFLGLSIEYWALENYAGPDPHAINPALVRLIRQLLPGGGLLRIGGVTTDKTWWPVRGVPQPKGINYSLSRRRLLVAGALARATDARLIMGIQFEADSSTLAGAEARAMLAAIGHHRLAAFELGNEPELFGNPNFAWYKVHGHPVTGRPAGYDLQAFTSDFAKIASALPGGVPLAGPSSTVGGWINPLSPFLSRAPRLGMVTLHHYPFQGCFLSPRSPAYPTISRLLSPAATTGQDDEIAPFVASASAYHLPVSVDEMNAVSCGSPRGVPNSFALALWVVDALFAHLAAGVDNVDVHTWPGAIYQLFTVRHGPGWRTSVEPEYYGLLLFARAAPPGSTLVRATTDNGLIRAWATRDPGGTLRIALINDDTAQAQSVSVQVAGARGPATAEGLRAPGASSTHGVTFAGQSFGGETSTGVLAGRRRTLHVFRRAGGYSLRLPAASAVLLTLH